MSQRQRKPFLLALLFAFILLNACRNDHNGPEPHIAGQILAGEVGDEILSLHYPEGRRLVDRTDTFRLVLVSDNGNDLKVEITKETFVNYPTNGVQNLKIYNMRGSDLRVEFAFETYTESTWLCESWSQDSSEHFQAYFNNPSIFECSNSLSLFGTTNYQVAPELESNAQISAAMDWKATVSSLVWSDNTNILNNVSGVREHSDFRTMRAFAFDSEAAYIPFRWAIGQGKYKYGWILAKTELSGDLVIYGYGMER